MNKLKDSQYKCKVCEKIYNKKEAYSLNYCNIICRNQAQKDREKAKREEKSKKNQMERALKPLICLYCKESFITDTHRRKYCSDICKDKITKELKENILKNKKKKLPSWKINSMLNNKAVRKDHFSSLNKFNSVRG